MRTASETIDPPGSGEGWWWRVWRAGAISALVAGDSAVWSAETAAMLAAQGFAVRHAGHSPSTLDAGLPYDIAVVEVGERHGVALCSALRSRSDLPILAVVPIGAPESLVLAAFAAGVDQCVTRSLSERELVARLRALLRRRPPDERNVIDLRALDDGTELVLDPATRRVAVGGRAADLTLHECAVLHALLRRPGRVVPRAELQRSGPAGQPPRSLDSLVRQLRGKLAALGSPGQIVAVRGVGFRYLAAPGAQP